VGGRSSYTRHSTDTTVQCQCVPDRSVPDRWFCDFLRNVFSVPVMLSRTIYPLDVTSPGSIIPVSSIPFLDCKGRTLVLENMFGVHCSGTLCLSQGGREVQPGRWYIGCSSKRRNLYCNKYGLILYKKSSFTYIHE
jgi:hypothetical protein